MKKILGKYKIQLFVGIVILAVLPLAVFLSQQTQLFQPRATEETLPQSTLTLVPSTFNHVVGQEFIVDLVLDTTKDPDFVVTGVDAIIDYQAPPELPTINSELQAISITNGTAFDSLTNQAIDPEAGSITISASNASVKDEAGLPQGFSGRGTVATITFKATQAGTPVNLSLNYTNQGATDDTNIIGFEKNKPVAEQTPRERLLSPPSPTTLTISEPDDLFFDTSRILINFNSPNSPSPTPVCIPRPQCLDENPACAYDLQPGVSFCTVIESIELKPYWGDIAGEGNEVNILVHFNRNNYQGGTGASATDWIGLYNPAAADSTFLDWRYVNNTQTAGNVVTSGTVTFPKVTPGTYQVRFFLNNGYQKIDQKPVVADQSTPASPAPISIAPTDLEPNQTYTATVQFGIQNLVKSSPVATTPVTIELKINGQTVATKDAPYNLIAEHEGGYGDTFTNVTFTAQKQNVIELVIDPNNTIAETNETNNSFSQTFTYIPQGSLQIKLSLAHRQDSPFGQATTGTVYGFDTSPVQGVTIAQFGELLQTVLTPTSATQNLSSLPQPPPGGYTLGNFVADENGEAFIPIPKSLQGKQVTLYLRTLSHLRKVAAQSVSLPSLPDCWPECDASLSVPRVEFTDLIPGDLHIAAGASEQDNIISDLDVQDLRTYLGTSLPKTSDHPVPHKADLNADGVVNIRDLQILRQYLGQRGDLYSGEAPPSVCLPQDKVITVYPNPTAGACYQLQQAIDNIPDTETGYTIKLAEGHHTIPESNDSYSLKILNKQNLTLASVATPAANHATLAFPQNRGGVLIKNSAATLRSLIIQGNTANGIVRIESGNNSKIDQSKISDSGASAIQIRDSSAVTISDSNITSSALALDVSSTQNITVNGNDISQSSHGISATNSSGYISSNIFHSISENAIRLTQSNNFTLTKNTIVDSANTHSLPAVKVESAAANAAFEFKNNIIAFNTAGVSVNTSSGATYTFDHNDIWNDEFNYQGVSDKTGEGGNISADPLFGDDYCLQDGSPTIYGKPSRKEYMGARPPCSGIPTEYNLADVNQDGIVDLSDYSILVSQFLQEGPDLSADLNSDGLVDLSDYSLFVANFLATMP